MKFNTHFRLTAALLFICTTAVAQVVDVPLSIKTAFLNPKAQPENLRQLQFNGPNLYFVRGIDGKDVFRQYDVATKKETTLFTPAVISSKANRFPALTPVANTKGNLFYFMVDSTLKTIDLTGKTEIKNTLPGANEDLNVCKVTLNAAYTVGNNLYIATNSTQKQITFDTNPDIVNGKPAHRNEFGIKAGSYFSPKGTLLAFYHMDQTMVTNYPLVKLGSKPAQVTNIKYPMAGQPSHHATIGIYNIATGKTIYLKTTGPQEQYLTNITFSPDEKSVFVAIVNRLQTQMQLCSFSTETGVLLKDHFTETHAKYVEPEDGPFFLPDGNYVWQSERNGFNNLYLYSPDGKLLKALTSQPLPVTEILGYQASTKKLWYVASTSNGLDRTLFSVNMAGKTIPFGRQTGTNNAQLSADGAAIAVVYSDTVTPREVMVFNTQKGTSDQLLKAQNPLPPFGPLPIVRYQKIKAEDGTLLNSRMILPVGFDANKKYPVIVYLYGGPHAQLVTNTWLGGANLWMYTAAQKGYIVYTIDNHGSDNRGLAFENATHHHLGTLEMEDQLKGVDYLKTLPYVDANRLGVHGWSFGGFMATSLMTRHPGVFKVAVAGGPVIDWSLYEIMYTERYMGTPQNNSEGYKANNLVSQAANLKGKLLLIHGTVDDVVVWQHSQEFLKACVSEGIQLDYFVYPEHPHNVLGKDRVHLYTKVLNYFDDYLK